jgi:hypothetical protein
MMSALDDAWEKYAESYGVLGVIAAKNDFMAGYNAGMTRAAEICGENYERHKGICLEYYEQAKADKDAILKARDSTPAPKT